MIPGMNPRDLQKAMKRLGMKQEEIEASEVIIKCIDKELVVHNPQVMKVDVMGQESLQITGKIEERPLSNIKEEDIDAVIEQTGVSKEEALRSLEENDGDIAKTILNLKD